MIAMRILEASFTSYYNTIVLCSIFLHFGSMFLHRGILVTPNAVGRLEVPLMNPGVCAILDSFNDFHSLMVGTRVLSIWIVIKDAWSHRNVDELLCGQASYR